MTKDRTRAAVMTSAAVLFKRHYGQRNHNLVTSVVGLELLRNKGRNSATDGQEVLDFSEELPEYLSGSWKVRREKLNHSINSSLQFVLFASLNLIVDAVDGYLKDLARATYPLPEDVRSMLLDQAEGAKTNGIKKRHEIVIGHVAGSDLSKVGVNAQRLALDSKLFHLSRELRNSWIHSSERSSLKDHLAGLEEHRDTISDAYKHFSPWQTVERFQKKSPDLSLKDVASLWASAERLVEQVDAILTANFGVKEFYSASLALHFDKAVSESVKNAEQRHSIRRNIVRQFLNKPRPVVIKSLKHMFEHELGFARTWTDDDLRSFLLGDEVLRYMGWLDTADSEELEAHLVGSLA